MKGRAFSRGEGYSGFSWGEGWGLFRRSLWATSCARMGFLFPGTGRVGQYARGSHGAYGGAGCYSKVKLAAMLDRAGLLWVLNQKSTGGWS